jgi:hypothetical protein
MRNSLYLSVTNREISAAGKYICGLQCEPRMVACVTLSTLSNTGILPQNWPRLLYSAPSAIHHSSIIVFIFVNSAVIMESLSK